MKLYDGSIIKFPSPLCNFSSHFYGEKIFLYRKLKHHLFKRKTQRGYNARDPIKYIISWAHEHHTKYCHPSLRDIKFDTDLKIMIFMWANKIQWMKDSNEVLWIESNSFFENKKKTMDLVCDHFNVPHVLDYSMANIYVKNVGMNHSDIQLKDVVPNMENVRYLYPSFGIIEDELCNPDKEILELVDWTNNNMPFISPELIV
jgi:hypothetical protein